VTVKQRAKLAGVAGALWLLTAVAAAQVAPRPPSGRDADGGSQRLMPVEERPDQLSSRDASIPGRGKRLSPEERRQLRRDVHEAGRDLYSGRMSSGRREPRSQ
jgi:hypothetical protein